MSYNAPPCLLRDWVQSRIEEKSEFLLKLEERQAQDAARSSPAANVTPLRARDAGNKIQTALADAGYAPR